MHTLAVGSWDGRLSFYQVSGAQIRTDRDLKQDPCTVSWVPAGNYVLVGGSSRKLTVHTRKGTPLATVAERNGWIWTAQQCPARDLVAVGTHDGKITMHKLDHGTVHALYQDRYAFRENMTDVMIQHLVTEQRVRIKCENFVRRVAVYANRVAVQLPEKIHVYELTKRDDPYDMHYSRMRRTMLHSPECDMLVVTAHHITLCTGAKMQAFDFGGTKVREWVLEAPARYIRAVGGPAGREGLLVGLQSGTVLKVFLDNPFPIALIRQRAAIRCLDLSARHVPGSLLQPPFIVLTLLSPLVACAAGAS